MEARMKNPATVLPGLTQAVGGLYKAMQAGGVPQETLELVHLRASQINGCSFCVVSGATSLHKAGESDERLWAVAAWREAPYFTDAERAALALTEAATRLADHTGEAVPDEVWDDAADHFDEKGLAAIITMIATSNFFNRINATIKQVAGAGWG
jgi:AhpD family alkylhydroperoxidase